MKKISAVKPPRVRKFSCGAFGFASEGIGGGETAVMERFGRYGTARFFEPDDRLLDASLQQMHGPDQVVPRTDVGIAGLRRMA